MTGSLSVDVDVDPWAARDHGVEERVGVNTGAPGGDAAGGARGFWEERVAVAGEVAADVVSDAQFGLCPVRIRPSRGAR